MIDARDPIIDMSKIFGLKQQVVSPEITKFIETRDENEVDVKQNSTIQLSISGRYETGGHAKGMLKYNPNQATNFKLGGGKKQMLTPIELQIVLTMKRNEVAWVRLEPGQHTYDSIKKPIYFRYEVKKVEDPKVSFSNMNLEEKYQMIRRRKEEADLEFTNKKYPKAKDIYVSCFGLFNQVSKKEKEAMTEAQTQEHKDLGRRIFGNLLSCLYLTKSYIEAKEFMKGAEKNLDAKNSYKIMAKYYEIAKKLGDKKLLKDVLKQLLTLEVDEAKKAKYAKEVDDILYENKKMNAAFLKALQEAEQEENREKTYRKIKDNINIVYEHEEGDNEDEKPEQPEQPGQE